MAFVANSASFLASLDFFGPSEVLFGNWKWVVFGHDLFERDLWRSILTTFAIYLALATAALFILERRARLLGQGLKPRVAKAIGIVITVLGVLTYFDFVNPNVRYNQYYHRHEFFHYYLGSKYFKEIGYSRIYECTAIAEIENGSGAKLKTQDLRDLRGNLIRPIKSTYVFSDPGQCKDHFAPERWTAFKKDISWFESSARGSYWDNMKKDHGYNPPPVWTMTGRFFSEWLPEALGFESTAGDTFFKCLSLLDIGFHIGVILLLGWAFGWRIMAVGSVFWGCNAVANFYWTGGAFMRQDWVFLIVAAVCFARKRRFMLSGGALTWAALLRVFPVITFFGAGVIALIHLIRHRRFHPDHLRFLGGAAVAASLLVPASMAATSVDGYQEFWAHINTHKHTPLTNHMGLETMLVHSWDGRMIFTQDDRMDDPFEGWKEGRRDRKENLKWLHRGIILLVAGWTVWALRRTKLLWVGIALSTPLVVTLLNLTCYYYVVFLIGVVLARVRPAIGVAMLATSAASQVLHYRFSYIDDKFTAHSYLFYVMALLMLFGYSRPFSVARLKAWLRGLPEPKSERDAPVTPKPPATPELSNG